MFPWCHLAEGLVSQYSGSGICDSQCQYADIEGREEKQ